MIVAFVLLFFVTPVTSFKPLSLSELKPAVEDWFVNATAAEALYGSISDWDVTSVVSMDRLFYGRDMTGIDISEWRTDSLRTADFMFGDDASPSTYTSGFCSWDVTRVLDLDKLLSGLNVENMRFCDPSWMRGDLYLHNMMYENAACGLCVGETPYSLGMRYHDFVKSGFGEKFVATDANIRSAVASTIFGRSDGTWSHPNHGPIGEWDTSAVTDMSNLFQYQQDFCADISAWDTSSVTDMSGMFQGTQKFDMYLDWDTSKVRNMRNMFADSAFSHGLAWDVSSVEDMVNMFPASYEGFESWDQNDVRHTYSPMSFAYSSRGMVDAEFISHMYGGEMVYDDVKLSLGKDAYVPSSSACSGDLFPADRAEARDWGLPLYYKSRKGYATGAVERVLSSVAKDGMAYEAPNSVGITIADRLEECEMACSDKDSFYTNDDGECFCSSSASLVSVKSYKRTSLSNGFFCRPSAFVETLVSNVDKCAEECLHPEKSDDVSFRTHAFWKQSIALSFMIEAVGGTTEKLCTCLPNKWDACGTDESEFTTTGQASMLQIRSGVTTYDIDASVWLQEYVFAPHVCKTCDTNCDFESMVDFTAESEFPFLVHTVVGTATDYTYRKCPDGYEWRESVCVRCDPNTYWVRGRCLECPHGTSSRAGALRCTSILTDYNIREAVEQLFLEVPDRSDFQDELSYLNAVRRFSNPHNYFGEVEKWDTSRVTDMSRLFKGRVFDKDISGWDVSRVEDMSEMFLDSTFSRDLRVWNVARVKKFDRMFSGSNVKVWHGWVEQDGTEVPRTYEMRTSDCTSVGYRHINSVEECKGAHTALARTGEFTRVTLQPEINDRVCYSTHDAVFPLDEKYVGMRCSSVCGHSGTVSVITRRQGHSCYCRECMEMSHIPIAPMSFSYIEPAGWCSEFSFDNLQDVDTLEDCLDTCRGAGKSVAFFRGGQCQCLEYDGTCENRWSLNSDFTFLTTRKEITVEYVPASANGAEKFDLRMNGYIGSTALLDGVQSLSKCSYRVKNGNNFVSPVTEFVSSSACDAETPCVCVKVPSFQYLEGCDGPYRSILTMDECEWAITNIGDTFSVTNLRDDGCFSGIGKEVCALESVYDVSPCTQGNDVPECHINGLRCLAGSDVEFGKCFFTDRNIHAAVHAWSMSPEGFERLYGRLSDWDVSRVVDMTSLFEDSDMNPDIRNWDVRSVGVIDRMFKNSNFNYPIDGLQFSALSSAVEAFEGSSFRHRACGMNFVRAGAKVAGSVKGANGLNNCIVDSSIRGAVVNWFGSMHLTFSGGNVLVNGHSAGLLDFELIKNAPIQVTSTVPVKLEVFRDFSMNFTFTPESGNYDILTNRFVANGEDVLHSVLQRNGHREYGYISDWDVSEVTDMSYLFSGRNITFSLSSWNTENVVTMKGMFEGADYDEDIRHWDVSSVETFAFMFKGSTFGQDLTRWQFIFKQHDGMFSENSNYAGNALIVTKFLSPVFTNAMLRDAVDLWFTDRDAAVEQYKDISEWRVYQVTDMSGLFKNRDFSEDLSRWVVSSVTDMSSMFEGSTFNGDISDWQVINVESMSRMFMKSKFNSPIRYWNVTNVRNMSQMFAHSSFNKYIGDWELYATTPEKIKVGINKGCESNDNVIVPYERGSLRAQMFCFDYCNGNETFSGLRDVEGRNRDRSSGAIGDEETENVGFTLVEDERQPHTCHCHTGACLKETDLSAERRDIRCDPSSEFIVDVYSDYDKVEDFHLKDVGEATRLVNSGHCDDHNAGVDYFGNELRLEKILAKGVPGKRYLSLSSGSCSSRGYRYITSKDDCRTAIHELFGVPEKYSYSYHSRETFLNYNLRRWQWISNLMTNFPKGCSYSDYDDTWTRCSDGCDRGLFASKGTSASFWKESSYKAICYQDTELPPFVVPRGALDISAYYLPNYVFPHNLFYMRTSKTHTKVETNRNLVRNWNGVAGSSCTYNGQLSTCRDVPSGRYKYTGYVKRKGKYCGNMVTQPKLITSSSSECRNNKDCTKSCKTYRKCVAHTMWWCSRYVNEEVCQNKCTYHDKGIATKASIKCHRQGMWNCRYFNVDRTWCQAHKMSGSWGANCPSGWSGHSSANDWDYYENTYSEYQNIEIKTVVQPGWYFSGLETDQECTDDLLCECKVPAHQVQGLTTLDPGNAYIQYKEHEHRDCSSVGSSGSDYNYVGKTSLDACKQACDDATDCTAISYATSTSGGRCTSSALNNCKCYTCHHTDLAIEDTPSHNSYSTYTRPKESDEIVNLPRNPGLDEASRRLACLNACKDYDSVLFSEHGKCSCYTQGDDDQCFVNDNDEYHVNYIAGRLQDGISEYSFGQSRYTAVQPLENVEFGWLNSNGFGKCAVGTDIGETIVYTADDAPEASDIGEIKPLTFTECKRLCNTTSGCKAFSHGCETEGGVSYQYDIKSVVVSVEDVTLGVCEGNCNDDADCATGLKCFQRSGSEAGPSMCSGDLVDGFGYCYEPGLCERYVCTLSYVGCEAEGDYVSDDLSRRYTLRQNYLDKTEYFETQKTGARHEWEYSVVSTPLTKRLSSCQKNDGVFMTKDKCSLVCEEDFSKFTYFDDGSCECGDVCDGDGTETATVYTYGVPVVGMATETHKLYRFGNVDTSNIFEGNDAFTQSLCGVGWRYRDLSSLTDSQRYVAMSCDVCDLEEHMSTCGLCVGNFEFDRCASSRAMFTKEYLEAAGGWSLQRHVWDNYRKWSASTTFLSGGEWFSPNSYGYAVWTEPEVDEKTISNNRPLYLEVTSGTCATFSYTAVPEAECREAATAVGWGGYSLSFPVTAIEKLHDVNLPGGCVRNSTGVIYNENFGVDCTSETPCVCKGVTRKHLWKSVQHTPATYLPNIIEKCANPTEVDPDVVLTACSDANNVERMANFDYNESRWGSTSDYVTFRRLQEYIAGDIGSGEVGYCSDGSLKTRAECESVQWIKKCYDRCPDGVGQCLVDDYDGCRAEWFGHGGDIQELRGYDLLVALTAPDQMNYSNVFAKGFFVSNISILGHMTLEGDENMYTYSNDVIVLEDMRYDSMPSECKDALPGVNTSCLGRNINLTLLLNDTLVLDDHVGDIVPGWVPGYCYGEGGVDNYYKKILLVEELFQVETSAINSTDNTSYSTGTVNVSTLASRVVLGSGLNHDECLNRRFEYCTDPAIDNENECEEVLWVPMYDQIYDIWSGHEEDLTSWLPFWDAGDDRCEAEGGTWSFKYEKVRSGTCESAGMDIVPVYECAEIGVSFFGWSDELSLDTVTSTLSRPHGCVSDLTDNDYNYHESSQVLCSYTNPCLCRSKMLTCSTDLVEPSVDNLCVTGTWSFRRTSNANCDGTGSCSYRGNAVPASSKNECESTLSCSDPTKTTSAECLQKICSDSSKSTENECLSGSCVTFSGEVVATGISFASECENIGFCSDPTVLTKEECESKTCSDGVSSTESECESQYVEDRPSDACSCDPEDRDGCYIVNGRKHVRNNEAYVNGVVDFSEVNDYFCELPVIGSRRVVNRVGFGSASCSGDAELDREECVLVGGAWIAGQCNKCLAPCAGVDEGLKFVSVNRECKLCSEVEPVKCAGEICAVIDNTCVLCPGGQFTNENFVGCGDCPRGTFGENGICLTCPVGRVSLSEGQSACTACPENTFSVATGCVPCELGFIAPAESSVCRETCYCWEGETVSDCGDRYGNYCETCKEGFVSRFGTCVADCVNGQFDSGTCVCNNMWQHNKTAGTTKCDVCQFPYSTMEGCTDKRCTPLYNYDCLGENEDGMLIPVLGTDRWVNNGLVSLCNELKRSDCVCEYAEGDTMISAYAPWDANCVNTGEKQGIFLECKARSKLEKCNPSQCSAGLSAKDAYCRGEDSVYKGKTWYQVGLREHCGGGVPYEVGDKTVDECARECILRDQNAFYMIGSTCTCVDTSCASHYVLVSENALCEKGETIIFDGDDTGVCAEYCFQLEYPSFYVDTGTQLCTCMNYNISECQGDYTMITRNHIKTYEIRSGVGEISSLNFVRNGVRVGADLYEIDNVFSGRCVISDYRKDSSCCTTDDVQETGSEFMCKKCLGANFRNSTCTHQMSRTGEMEKNVYSLDIGERRVEVPDIKTSVSHMTRTVVTYKEYGREECSRNSWRGRTTLEACKQACDNSDTFCSGIAYGIHRFGGCSIYRGSVWNYDWKYDNCYCKLCRDTGLSDHYSSDTLRHSSNYNTHIRSGGKWNHHEFYSGNLVDKYYLNVQGGVKSGNLYFVDDESNFFEKLSDYDCRESEYQGKQSLQQCENICNEYTVQGKKCTGYSYSRRGCQTQNNETKCGCSICSTYGSTDLSLSQGTDTYFRIRKKNDYRIFQFDDPMSVHPLNIQIQRSEVSEDGILSNQISLVHDTRTRLVSIEDVENVKFLQSVMADEYRFGRTAVETLTMEADRLFGRTWQNGHCAPYNGHAYSVESFDECFSKCLSFEWCAGFSYDEEYGGYDLEWSDWLEYTRSTVSEDMKLHIFLDWYGLDYAASTFVERIQRVVPRLESAVCRLSNTQCKYDEEIDAEGSEKNIFATITVEKEYGVSRDSVERQSVKVPVWRTRGAKRYAMAMQDDTSNRVALTIRRDCERSDILPGGECCAKTAKCSDYDYTCTSGTFLDSVVESDGTFGFVQFQKSCCVTISYEYSANECRFPRCLDCDAAGDVVTDASECAGQFGLIGSLGSMCDGVKTRCLFPAESNDYPSSWKMVGGKCVYVVDGVDYTICRGVEHV